MIHEIIYFIHYFLFAWISHQHLGGNRLRLLNFCFIWSYDMAMFTISCIAKSVITPDSFLYVLARGQNFSFSRRARFFRVLYDVWDNWQKIVWTHLNIKCRWNTSIQLCSIWLKTHDFSETRYRNLSKKKWNKLKQKLKTKLSFLASKGIFLVTPHTVRNI